MTKQEFDRVKAKLSPHQRIMWTGILPICNERTFFQELHRPDGIIEVTFPDRNTFVSGAAYVAGSLAALLFCLAAGLLLFIWFF